RDRNVTGVQTCALPISSGTASPITVSLQVVTSGAQVLGEDDMFPLIHQETAGHPQTLGVPAPLDGEFVWAREVGFAVDLTHHLRSEERRVGRERRARWT